ncbi:hypothetical protein OLX23_21185 [Novosphingobium sp. JCM 18896]|nr:hypothetical protein [Novosphingobium sp. JCM 18896]
MADRPERLCRYDEIEREIGGPHNALAVYSIYIRTALVPYGLMPAITVEKGNGYSESGGLEPQSNKA